LFRDKLYNRLIGQLRHCKAVMRIAIYGTGGAGGYFGAQLARSGEDVTFVARGQHLKAIQAHGLCLETPAGKIVIQQRGQGWAPFGLTQPTSLDLLKLDGQPSKRTEGLRQLFEKAGVKVASPSPASPNSRVLHRLVPPDVEVDFDSVH
jgi:ketopantoate reductase